MMNRIATILAGLAILGIVAVPAQALTCPGSCQGPIGFPYCQGDFVSTWGCRDGTLWCASTKCVFLEVSNRQPSDIVLANSSTDNADICQFVNSEAQQIYSDEASQDDSNEFSQDEGTETKSPVMEVRQAIEILART